MDRFTDVVIWSNTLARWGAMLAILAAVLPGARVLKGAVVSHLRKLSARTETSLDDIAVAVLDGTQWWCMAP